ncbi:hypothetical protein ACFXJO_16555 [Streptomyces lavendulae]|uniref:hypothetical protein n=1 Tax=Streptomyces lavendulae TaxID=1914 RepID=UPI0036C8DADC
MPSRFSFVNWASHGSTGDKKTFGRPDRTVRGAANRGEDFRITGRDTSKPSGWLGRRSSR